MGDDNNLLDVSENEKFIKQYKSVYQAMTAKHDCRSKIFPRNVKINIGDICELNVNIVEKLQKYLDAGFTIAVSVSFAGKQSIEFSSWGEFEQHKWNESSAINSITIIWEFNAILPQISLPQKHVLVVKMADGLRPEEMINIVFAGKLENIEDIDKQMYPVVARVDFINYALGDELLKTVEDWNKGLEIQDREQSKLIDVARKHRRKIAFGLNYLTDIFTLFCELKIVTYLLESFKVVNVANLTIANLNDLLRLIVILIVIFVFIDKISEWMANIFYKTVDLEHDTHVFAINRGDKNIQEKLERDYKRTKKLTVWSVLGTFIINLFCTIICSIII